MKYKIGDLMISNIKAKEKFEFKAIGTLIGFKNYPVRKFNFNYIIFNFVEMNVRDFHPDHFNPVKYPFKK